MGKSGYIETTECGPEIGWTKVKVDELLHMWQLTCVLCNSSISHVDSSMSHQLSHVWQFHSHVWQFNVTHTCDSSVTMWHVTTDVYQLIILAWHWTVTCHTCDTELLHLWHWTVTRVTPNCHTCDTECGPCVTVQCHTCDTELPHVWHWTVTRVTVQCHTCDSSVSHVWQFSVMLLLLIDTRLYCSHVTLLLNCHMCV